MRHSAQFSAVVRSGRRVGGRALVVHHLAPTPASPSGSAAPAGASPVDDRAQAAGAVAPQIGFVVSKSVGGSVVRHRVARRLRAVLTARLADLPTGSSTVVRALPASGTASSAELGADVDRALRRLVAR